MAFWSVPQQSEALPTAQEHNKQTYRPIFTLALSNAEHQAGKL